MSDLATYGMPQGSEPAAGGAMPPGGVAIDEDTRRTLRQLYQRARDHADDELGRKIERCWRYYDGFVDAPPAFEVGTSEDGRPIYHGSKMVVREVWDKVQAVLPELARVFLSSDEIVSFEPKRAGQEQHAAQATDYGNYLFWSENDGEELLLSAAIDWMVKFAALKVYWLTETKDERHTFQVDEIGLRLLLERQNDPASGITTLDAMPIELPQYPTLPEPANGGMAQPQMPPPPPDGAAPDPAMMPETQGTPAMQPMAGAMAPPPGMASPMGISVNADLRSQMAPPTMYHVEMVREIREGRVQIELIPQDEFLVDPDAYTVDDALMVGQDTYRTVSEVVAWGVPFEVVRQYSGKTNSRERNDAAMVARRGRSTIPNRTDVGDPTLDYVRVVEAIVKLDLDRDGIAERVRVLMLGEGQEPVWVGPGNDCHYICGSPYRRPHEVVGSGFGEELADLQDDKTAVSRGIRNSLNRSIIPREIVADDDDVGYADLKSPLNGPIRSANPGALQFHVVPYIGESAFGILNYLDELSAQRTGVTPAGQGLDPDVLKGQTAEGAKTITLAPQSRIEYFVREFAASIMRPLFRAILRISAAFQDKPKTIRLRGEWVEVDPSGWDAEMDCSVKVGLGSGTRGEKLQGIVAIKQLQMEAMAAKAPQVSWKEIGETATSLIHLVGFKDAGRFWKEMSDDDLKAAMDQAEQSGQAAAQQAIQAQIALEGAKAQAKAAADQQSAQHAAELLHQRETMKIQADDAAAVRDHELKLSQIASQERATLDKQAREYDLKQRELAIEFELERFRIENRAPAGDANIAQAGAV